MRQIRETGIPPMQKTKAYTTAVEKFPRLSSSGGASAFATQRGNVARLLAAVFFKVIKQFRSGVKAGATGT